MSACLPFLRLPSLAMELVISHMSATEQIDFSFCSKRCARIIRFFGMFRKADMDITLQANKRIVLEKGGEEMMEFSVSMEPMDWCEVNDYKPRIIDGVTVGMKKENDRWLMFIPFPGSSSDLPLPALHNHVKSLLLNTTVSNLTLDFDDFTPCLTSFFLSLSAVRNLKILSLGASANNELVSHFKENVEVFDRFIVNLRHPEDCLLQFCDSKMKTRVLVVKSPAQYLANFYITECERIYIEQGDYQQEEYEAIVSKWYTSEGSQRLKSVAVNNKQELVALRLEEVKIKEHHLVEDHSELDWPQIDIIISREDGATASVVDAPQHFSFWAFS